MSPRSLLPLAALTLAGVLGGCGGNDENGGERVVVATTTQVADLARNVAGSRAEVRALLRPNSDPHDYEPRPSDAVAIGKAMLVLRSGGDLDGWLEDLVESAGGDAKVLTLTDAVRARGEDPHWWQDPRNAERAIRSIAAGLAAEDPEGRDVYSRNVRAYLARLRVLDESVARCIERLPRAQRRLVTTHDSLGYFAARYGIRVVGALIPSLSTEGQPSSGDTAKLVRQIRDEGVKAIFPESSLTPRLERAVSREAGASVGEALWADTLGPEGSGGATYIDSIASNTEALVAGLSGGKQRCRPRA
jgi:ABC-type Zn uptake system ZnuABC Zn-binding protein ZnuA